MKKPDQAVTKETTYIAVWVLIFSALMQAVFLIIGRWNYTVLLGNLLSASAAVLNFFLMALSVVAALEKEESEAKNTMKLSRLYRFLFLAVVIIIGAVAPCFDIWAVVIPVLFPRVAIALRPLFDKNKS